MDKCTEEKTSAWPRIIAALTVFAIGTAIAGSSIYSSLKGLTAGFVPVQAPGTQELVLNEKGTYDIVYENGIMIGQKVNQLAGNPSDLLCRLKDTSTGNEVIVSTASVNFGKGEDGQDISVIFKFILPAPGTYLFSSSYPPGVHGPEAYLSVGRDPQESVPEKLRKSVWIMLGTIIISCVLLFLPWGKKSRKDL